MSSSSSVDGKADEIFPGAVLSEFGDHVTRKANTDFDQYAMEMEVLQHLASQQPGLYHEGTSKQKDRWGNVAPNEEFRVKLAVLNNDSNSDYINASHFPNTLLPRCDHGYVAASAPLPRCFEDWWRMVWEYDMTLIVMLTNLREKLRLKADQYWPEGKVGTTQKHGMFTVRVTAEPVMKNDVIIRSFLLSHANGQSKECVQIHYTTWSDFSSPSDFTSLHRLFDIYRAERARLAEYDAGRNAVLTHCSAGIGRTGTFIAIDALLDFLNVSRMEQDGDVDPQISVFNVVRKLRDFRPGMVQTRVQYLFIHQFVQYCIENGLLGAGIPKGNPASSKEA